MKRSVVGSLLMFLVLFGSTAIHAVRIQPVFAGVEEEYSSEERAEESYRAAAPTRTRRSRHLRAPISLVDIILRSSRQPIRSITRAQPLLIDPHELLQALRI